MPKETPSAKTPSYETQDNPTQNTNRNERNLCQNITSARIQLLWLVSCVSLRKTDKFRIPRHPILPNAFLLKPLLHPYPPRLVKANSPPLHDSQHLPLSRIIETRTFIAANNIIRDIEGGRVQPGFDVALETGGDWRVTVEVECWERGEGEGGDAFAGLGEPAGARKVEDYDIG